MEGGVILRYGNYYVIGYRKVVDDFRGGVKIIKLFID
jgi:hypothetical protein